MTSDNVMKTEEEKQILKEQLKSEDKYESYRAAQQLMLRYKDAESLDVLCMTARNKDHGFGSFRLAAISLLSRFFHMKETSDDQKQTARKALKDVIQDKDMPLGVRCAGVKALGFDEHSKAFLSEIKEKERGSDLFQKTLKGAIDNRFPPDMSPSLFPPSQIKAMASWLEGMDDERIDNAAKAFGFPIESQNAESSIEIHHAEVQEHTQTTMSESPSFDLQENVEGQTTEVSAPQIEWYATLDLSKQRYTASSSEVKGETKDFSYTIQFLKSSIKFDYQLKGNEEIRGKVIEVYVGRTQKLLIGKAVLIENQGIIQRCVDDVSLYSYEVFYFNVLDGKRR